MSRFKLFSCLFIIAALFVSSSAFAATNGPHGGYVSDTDACGKCHNTHASNGAILSSFTLAGTDNPVYEACVYCHKVGGQSKYDVIDGAIISSTGNIYAAAGGGIEKMVTVEGQSSISAANTTATTSAHEVKAKTSNYVAPGGSTTAFTNMSCNACHSAHGTTASRALLTTVNGVTPATKATITLANELADEAVTYNAGFDEFCSTCHADFNATASGAGSTDSGTYTQKKRHRVGMGLSYTYNGSPVSLSTTLPLENNTVSCMTCHYAHGTAVTNTTNFDRSSTYNGASSSNSSTLLRMNNRGVCQDCHKK